MKYLKLFNEKTNYDIFINSNLGDKDIKILECESFITEDKAIKYLQNMGS
jgi:hypothetical protein